MRYNLFSYRPVPVADPITARTNRFRVRHTPSPRSGATASDADFWRRRLIDVPLTLNLPFVLPGARSTGVSCATAAFETPDWLTDKLHRLARTEVVSVFTVILSAWEVLMYRYSDQSEFVVGCSSPNGRGSFPHQPGLVHASVSGEMSFSDLLRLNARRRAEGVAHDGSDLDALTAAVAPTCDGERHPIFQTAIIQRPVLTERYSPATQAGTRAPCELVCVFQAGTSAIRGRIEFPSGIMPPEQSCRLSTHFLNILRAALSLTNAPIASLPFRTPAEYLQATSQEN